MNKDSILNALEALNLTEPIQVDISLTRKTYMKVGGLADFLVTVSNLKEIEKLWKCLKENELNYFLLGKGSNLIFTEQGFNGVIIQLGGEFSKIRFESGNRVISGTGVSDAKFSRLVRQQALSGAEFLATVPGTIGGAIYMNAGAHGVQTSDLLKAITWLEDGIVKTENIEQLDFSYRHSEFMRKERLILFGEFELVSGDIETITATEKKYKTFRKERQPIKEPTCGSVFMNPEGDSAGRLIEACGLKGKGNGKARISPKHANFIENLGEASYSDILYCIDLARNKVKENFSIELKLEARVIGSKGETLTI